MIAKVHPSVCIHLYTTTVNLTLSKAAIFSQLLFAFLFGVWLLVENANYYLFTYYVVSNLTSSIMGMIDNCETAGRKIQTPQKLLDPRSISETKELTLWSCAVIF
jgi:hypothetical protein